MEDFLRFRRMLTPLIIEIVFWVLSGLVVITSVMGIIMSLYGMTQDFGAGLVGFLLSILQLALVIVFRIYAELIIVFFRMNETLTDIRNDTRTLASRPVTPS